MLFGRVSRKIFLAHPRTNFSKFMTGTSNGTGFCGQMKQKINKKSFLAANPPDGFGAHNKK